MTQRRFARFAWGVLAYNLAVILWGAYVRATGSGAGCGSHWPLCNGEVIPRAPQVETLVELTHRATSGLALLAVIALWALSRRLYAAGHPVRLGATLSLLFIIIEALLGAGLVLFELVAENDSWIRAFSMVAHLVNTFILVAVLSLTGWWASGGRAIRLRGAGLPLRLIAVAAVGLLAVGATGAIAALGDTLFPSSTLEQGLRDSFASDSHPLVQLRKYHPLLAVLVGGWVAATARMLSRLRPDLTVSRLAGAVIGMYVLQVVVGASNIILLAPISMQLLHLLMADVLWIAFVLLSAAALAADGPVERQVRPEVSVATPGPLT